MPALREAGYHWSSTVIWAKDSLVLSRKDYHTQYEPLWYGWLEKADGKAKRLCPLKDRKQSDLWQIPRPKVSAEHPTMKPVALVAKALLNSSRTGDIVLDLFGGSGTTLIAAEQTERICRMMELDPKYCDVIVRRYIELTGSDDSVFLLQDGVKSSYAEVICDG
jgi:DNA modification methylase